MNNNFRLFAFCILLFVVSFVSGAEIDSKVDIESSLAAVKNEDYEKAFSQFQLLANKGDPEAQHNLAMLYMAGKGTKKDLEKSNEWFRKAANQGIPDAQYYLGNAYDVGNGIVQNKNYAFIWYRKAAEKGHGMAQINLGVLYANGLGVKQDVEQAYLWFHVAAAQGYKAAFENKKIIEEALEPEVLGKLKEKGRLYFQQYVLPFQRHSLSYPRIR